ncbi:hypothetical protein FDA94_00825 [Herbidospora galbida]|uniref:Uncharacterized protein n=1 Tax=Herbidospora galbida TaxID=2575442 RepID=A0A4U3MRA1_9ACTN|nr:hypothetical protein [Herbidospora galbida]TKK91382.1 hypothetical protein FDA94_00825 [Herbidospora galbida]
MPASLGCPVCQAPAGHQCRRRDGRTRPPHLHGVALAAAGLILTWIAEHFLSANVFGHLLLLIETEHTLGPIRADRRARPLNAPLTEADRRRAPQWEREMLLLATHLQDGVEEILTALDGRSLKLKDERAQALALYTTLTHLRRAIELLPETWDDPHEPPALRRLQQLRDRDLNTELATRIRQRDDHAQHTSGPSLPPARWQVTRHDPNGVFEAHPLQADGLLGPRFGGWAPLPQAVPALLRAWSIPASRPVEVAWPNGRPMTPQWLLPYGGRQSGHRGDDPDHQRGREEALEGLWHDHRDRHHAIFADHMRRLREDWPGHTSVEDYLEQRTAEINASRPPAPDLDQLLESTYKQHHEIGPRLDDSIGLGVTVTCGWIAPRPSPTWATPGGTTSAVTVPAASPLCSRRCAMPRWTTP